MDGKDQKTGRFLPNNKLGGRRGALSHRRRALEHLSSNSDAIIQTAITAALAGDTQLLTVLVKMLVPTGGIPAEIANGDPITAYEQGEINSAELRNLMTSIEKARTLDATFKDADDDQRKKVTSLPGNVSDEEAAEMYRRMIER